jgi:hypothetical protein
MVSILKNPIRVMKITGHTNYKTFIEVYVNIDEEIALEPADALDAAHAIPGPLIEGTEERVN